VTKAKRTRSQSKWDS